MFEEAGQGEEVRQPGESPLCLWRASSPCDPTTVPLHVSPLTPNPISGVVREGSPPTATAPPNVLFGVTANLSTLRAGFAPPSFHYRSCPQLVLPLRRVRQGPIRRPGSPQAPHMSVAPFSSQFAFGSDGSGSPQEGQGEGGKGGWRCARHSSFLPLLVQPVIGVSRGTHMWTECMEAFGPQKWLTL